MDVLLALCKANGNVVSTEELLAQCWGGVICSDSPVHKNVALLRRLLGDNAGAPVFIETIRKRGYRAVAELDFDFDGAAGRAAWDGGSPFRGLLPFDEAHASVFFGRDDVIRKLAKAAQAQIDSGLALLLVLGPSGAGKTSVVQAGLFPALLNCSGATSATLLAAIAFDVADQGEQTLFTALAGALLDLQWTDQWAFAGESAVALGMRLAHQCDSVIADLHAMLAAQAGNAGLRFGILIDRFEALFNANRIGAKERDAFIEMLGRLARCGACLLVLACRNDFYPSIARYDLLTEGKCQGAHFDLAPPGFSDVAQIIRKPAAAAGLTFGVDPGSGARLDDVLCERAVGMPDALPLLQYCLHELYRLRSPEDELSFSAFHALGDIDGAIGRRAEQVVVGLTSAQRDALPQIMSLVTVLSLDEENVTSQRAPWSALRSEDARQAVSALVEARLFVSDLTGSIPVFGIAHDAILRRWPRMTDWIAAHRHALRARGRLAQQAARWAGEGQSADLLLPSGKLLEEAKQLRQAGIWTLEQHEHELIARSERRALQRERKRLFALALIAVLAALSSALGISAMAAKRSAEQRRAEAENLVGFMLGDFADRLRPIGRLDLLESVSGKAMEYLGGGAYDASPAALTLHAKGLQVIGEVSRARGDATQAIDALANASTILRQQHAHNPHDIEVLKNLGANAYWIGQIHKDHNNLQAAGDAWRQYRHYADQLHQLQPDNVEWWVEQSYTRNNLGSLALAQGMPELAVPEFVASIALKERALGHVHDPKMMTAELADSYSWLASARQSLGELQAAEQLYEKEMDAIQWLRSRFPGESLWINRHGRALQHRAAIALAQGMDDSALRDYEEAQRLLKQIAEQDRNNSAWQVELANIEQHRLKILARRLHGREVLPKLVQVHTTLEAMLRLNPKNAGWIGSEAVARSHMAAAHLRMGNIRSARQQTDIALASLQELYASAPFNLHVRLSLISTLLLSAKIHHTERDIKKTMSTCSQIHGMMENDIKNSRNYQLLDPWVRVNTCLSNHAAAELAAKRLREIGYRDSSYIAFITAINKEFQ